LSRRRLFVVVVVAALDVSNLFTAVHSTWNGIESKERKLQ